MRNRCSSTIPSITGTPIIVKKRGSFSEKKLPSSQSCPATSYSAVILQFWTNISVLQWRCTKRTGDLVIELPLAAALSSAEGFSHGAIATLEQMGCVTHLSFGSECGDITRIQKAARADRSLIPHYITWCILRRSVSSRQFPPRPEMPAHCFLTPTTHSALNIVWHWIPLAAHHTSDDFPRWRCT